MAKQLKFPLGFDLKEGTKKAIEEWKSTYRAKIQAAVDKQPIKLKLLWDAKGVNVKQLKEWVQMNKVVQQMHRDSLATKRQEIALETDIEKRNKARLATETQLYNLTSARARATHASAREAAKRTLEENKALQSNLRLYERKVGVLGRLVQRAAVYFSIHQVANFLSKVKDVTKEMELQRSSLGALIGDIGRANLMYSQIQQNALKSPFNIRELIDYTKKVAAYRIESDELIDTTMRLADVSAGLGVSMDRIVLAYGQIRATGYLRATEVRQLTEAGLPIVESLAEQMSNLRQETVTAAEVMGLISERAISFEQVKAIFEDLTSAGGIFYKMQEKQADTLYGKWENLKDAATMMYEAIGKSTLGRLGLETALGTLKVLIKQWKLLAGVVMTTADTFLLLKVGQGIMRMLSTSTYTLAIAVKQHKKAILDLALAQKSGGATAIWAAKMQVASARAMRQAAMATNGFKRALLKLKAAFLSNPIGMIAAAAAALAAILITVISKTNELGKALGEIDSRGTMTMSSEVNNFERLAVAIRSNAASSLKHKNALKELKRAYGEFLPTQDDAIRKLVKEKEGYENVTDAIREKIAMQMQEEKINQISSHYADALGNYEKRMKDRAKEQGYKGENLADFFAEIQKEVKDGAFDDTLNDVNEIRQKFASIFNTFFGKELAPVDVYHIFEPLLGQSIPKYIKTLSEYNNAIAEVVEEMKTLTGVTREYRNDWDKLQTDLQNVGGGSYQPFTFNWNETNVKNQIELYHKTVEKWLKKADIDFTIGKTIDFSKLYEALGDAQPKLKSMIQKLQKEYSELIPNNVSQKIKDDFIRLAKSANAPMDKIQNYFKDNEKSVKDWVSTLKSAKEDLVWQIGTNENLGETTTELKAIKKVIEEMIKLWDKSTKTEKKGNDEAVSALKAEIKAVESMYKRYLELKKSMSDAGKIKSTLETEFADVNLKRLEKVFNTKDMEKVYELAKKLAQQLGDEALVLEIETKIGGLGVKETVRDIEQKLLALSDKVSRTKTAKEFYDRMLGITGNKELSATLTLSVYGETGESLKDDILEQAKAAFKDTDVKFGDKLDLSALRKAYNALPEGYPAAQKKAMKQVLDILEKEQSNIAAKYAELLLAYDDVARKRVTIEQKAAKDVKIIEKGLAMELAKINEDYKNDETKKDTATTEAKARADAAKDAINARKNYDLKKLSDEYVRFFAAINSMTMETANNTRATMRKALFEAFNAGGISAEELRKELRAIEVQFKKLNESSSLFVAYLNGGAEGWLEKLRESGDELDALAIKMQKMQKVEDLTADEQSFIDKMLRAFGKKGSKSLAQLSTQFNGDMSKMGKAVAEVGGEMQGMFSGATGALTIVDTIIKNIGGAIDGIDQILGQINSMRSEENQIGGWFEYVSDFNKYAMSGWENLKSGNLLGAVADTVSSIISIFQNISEDQIEAIDEAIEEQALRLENLEYAYGRFEKAQEKAFGSDYIDIYNKKLSNLQAQYDAYMKQAQLEESKGKAADSDKIRDYENAARDVADSIKDMYGSMSEHFLGQDLTSAARDFAQAWIEAYKEFSNTTDAMKEKFQDMIQNMMVESLLAKVMEQALEPVFTMIDNMESSDFYNSAFWANVMDTMDKAATDGVVGAENVMKMFEQMGVSVRSLGGEMTGISRDIATASEESILGLAAGINTQNYYISQVPAKMDIIIGLLRGEGTMTQGSAITLQDLVTLQNQHLSYLPTIAQHTADTVAECKTIVAETRRTADALERVIKPEGTKATYKLNTTLS